MNRHAARSDRRELRPNQVSERPTTDGNPNTIEHSYVPLSQDLRFYSHWIGSVSMVIIEYAFTFDAVNVNRIQREFNRNNFDGAHVRRYWGVDISTTDGVRGNQQFRPFAAITNLPDPVFHASTSQGGQYRLTSRRSDLIQPNHRYSALTYWADNRISAGRFEASAELSEWSWGTIYNTSRQRDNGNFLNSLRRLSIFYDQRRGF